MSAPPMIRYRLALHASLATRTIIAEANVTHMGMPKPLYVREALSDAELRRWRPGGARNAHAGPSLALCSLRSL